MFARPEICRTRTFLLSARNMRAGNFHGGIFSNLGYNKRCLSITEKPFCFMMMYDKKDYSHILGTEGFSDDLLTNHFNLYAGYVKNVNMLDEKLRSAEVGTPEYAELRRRFGWEWNGMRLHELYFGNITKETNGMSGELEKKISEKFGSREAWEADFRATGAMRGIGWVILAHDTESDALHNVWINEHDVGHLAGAKPLLVMDVFEHAFVFDYGMNRADYIDAFMNAVDWRAVEERM